MNSHIFLRSRKFLLRAKLSHPIIILFLIILSFPFIIKYTFVAHNQYEQIPLIHRFLNPTYLANDWSVNLNSQFSPRSYFTIYIGTWAKLIPLPVVYFIHYYIAVGLVCSATYILSSLLFYNPYFSLLTTAVILYGQKITLGGNDLIGRDFDPPRFAFALAVFGFSALLTRRQYLSSSMFAAAAYMQPLIGFEAPLIFYSAYLVVLKKLLSHYPLKSLITYLILITPAVYTYLNQLSTPSTIPDSAIIAILTKIASPFHYAPLSWPLIDYVKFIVLLIMMVYIAKKLPKKKSNFPIQIVATTVTIILVLCAIAYVSTEITPYFPVIVAQLFRMTVIVYWFAATIIVGGSIWLLVKKTVKLGWAGALFLLILLVLTTPSIGLMVGKSHFLFMTIVTAIVVITKYYKRVTILTVILVIFAFATLYRYYTFNFTNYYPVFSEEIRISQWAKTHTSENSLFLIPPSFFVFRLNAQRAAVVDWLVLTFTRDGMWEWLTRIVDVSGLYAFPITEINESRVYEGFNQIDDFRITQLHQKYDFDYVIAKKTAVISLPVVEVFDEYVVYKGFSELIAQP